MQRFEKYLVETMRKPITLWRREERRTEGRKEDRKEGRKEGQPGVEGRAREG